MHLVSCLGVVHVLKKGVPSFVACGMLMATAGISAALAAPGDPQAPAPADLWLELGQHKSGSRDLKLAISNNGGSASAAGTLQIETLAPGSDAGSGAATVPVPAVQPGHSHRFLADYKLAQACGLGVRVRASLNVPGDPSDGDTLVAYPCQPDLQITFKRQASDQVLEFTVENLGGETAPARNVHFDSLTTPPSNSVDVSIGALKPGQSTTVAYNLQAPCPGLKVRAVVPLSEDGDQTNNSIELFPCGPDLQMSFLRYIDANHDLAFQVTNVGGQPARAVTATVEKVAPAQAPRDAREFPVPALQPGQSFAFTYSIGPGLCLAGLTVRASAALDIDANPSDNSFTQQVCDDIHIVAPLNSLAQRLPRRPGVARVASVAPGANTPAGDLVFPDQAPGTHRVDLSPSASQSRIQSTRLTLGLPGCFTGMSTDDGQLLVGWAQATGSALGSSCQWTGAAQTAVRFDFSQIDQVPNKQITSAVLTFDEQEARWTESDGSARQVPGCVAVLGLANSDWAAGDPSDGLFPNATIVDFRPWPSDRQDFNGRQFDVTGWVQTMFFDNLPVGPDLRTPRRFGFVLRGAIEDLNGDDFTSCMSTLSNIQLHLTYDVPPPVGYREGIN
jgi:hypothetical protein